MLVIENMQKLFLIRYRNSSLFLYINMKYDYTKRRIVNRKFLSNKSKL